jgi:tRNA(fMet)-specific endonuclease VapC
MKQALIDTNIYSNALKGEKQAVSLLKGLGLIGISSISIGELLSGFKGGKREKENRRELEEFLDSPRVRMYSVDEDTAQFYAEVLNELRKKGTPIPTNDIWIASVALQKGLPLCSRDVHFRKVQGLVLLS